VSGDVWTTLISTPSEQCKSAQCNHLARRNCPKCGQILLILANAKISQYFGTFWTFSPNRVVRLSWFLLYWDKHLETQYIIPKTLKIQPPPPFGTLRLVFNEKQIISCCSLVKKVRLKTINIKTVLSIFNIQQHLFIKWF
jgi:hypothetical protein